MGAVAVTFAVVGGLLLFGIPGAGPVLAMIWVAGCYFASRTIRRSPELVDEPKSGAGLDPQAVQVRGPKAGATEHAPPAPLGEQREPWSPDTKQLEVAGEWYRREQLRSLFTRFGTLSAEGSELDFEAALVADPANPHDGNAVAVYVQGLHVGYMERGDAARYHVAMSGLRADGIQPVVRSRQWVRSSGHELWARVTIWLPEPGGFLPANQLPADALILPLGSAVQVTKEDEHLDVLAPIVSGAARVAVSATLHEVTDVRPRSTAQVVEVRIDGNRVGVLTSTQTANVMPLVRLAARSERVATVRAIVHGNSLKADVTLYVAKAQDVEPDWIHAHDVTDTTSL